MTSNIKEKKQPFPIYPIEKWSVLKYGVKKLYINPDWGITYPETPTLDVEDDEQGNFVGIGVYCPKLNVCYYWSEKPITWMLPIRFIAHNGVSDLKKLREWGYDYPDESLVWDTQLMAHVLDSSKRQYGLKALVKEDLGIEYPSYEDIVGKRTEKQTKPRITLDKQPLELVANYNAMDTFVTYKLYQKQSEQKLKYVPMRTSEPVDTALYYHNRIELPSSFVFDKMRTKGIRVDLPYLTALKDTLEAHKRPLIEDITNELGAINLNSPKQLIGALNAKGITPVLKSKPSTDKRALDAWRHMPIVQNLLKFSELETLLSSFVTPYLERAEEVGQKDGDFVVHPQFRQTGTRTGRPSCSNPNLLQIPRRTTNGAMVRQMFISRNGFTLGELDYKEGEPRMLAHLSGDKDMCALFNEGRGFHDYFAEHLNISRDKAKVFDLETYYRATKFGVARHLNCSLNEAQTRINEAWALFPGLWDWEQKVIYDAKKNGYITTLMGRRIKIEGLDNANSWQREAAERQAMNNLAQGSLQECVKLSMIEMDRSDISLLVQVYDSLLFESPDEAIELEMAKGIGIMENCVSLNVPLVVSTGIGKNWAECHA